MKKHSYRAPLNLINFRLGFSLMETMIVLLITAIIAAATAPMVTKKMSRSAGSGDNPWIFTGLRDDIAYLGTRVLIGATSLPADCNAKLYIQTPDDEDIAHIAFGGANGTVTGITADGDRNRFGISTQTEIPDNSVMMGRNNLTDTSNSSDLVAIGANTISSSHSITLGSGAIASGNNSIAIGCGTKDWSIDLLPENFIWAPTYSPAIADGLYSIAIGTTAHTYEYGIAIGYDTEAWDDSVAIGRGANATNTYGDTKTRAIAIGPNAWAGTTNAIAIGDSAGASSHYATAIGHHASTLGGHCIAIGSGARTGRDELRYDKIHSIAIGTEAHSPEIDTIAIGREANAVLDRAIAIGAEALATEDSIAIGVGAKATHKNAIVIGNGAETHKQHQMVLDANNICLQAREELILGDMGTNVVIDGTLNVAHLRAGEIHGTMVVDELPTLSDRRLKNVGEEYKGGLEELKKLEFFHYTFKDDEAKTPHVGVIAQDLKKVFPDAVTEDKDGYLQIRKEDMFYAVINAIKELDKKITEILANVKTNSDNNASLKQTVEAQQKIIEELQQQNKELEKRLAKIEKHQK